MFTEKLSSKVYRAHGENHFMGIKFLFLNDNDDIRELFTIEELSKLVEWIFTMQVVSFFDLEMIIIGQ